MLSDDKMILAHSGDCYDQFLGSIAPPIFLSSLFRCKNLEEYGFSTPGKHIYSRYSNPDVSILEQKVAELEHGKYCLAYANGMAAASAALLANAKVGGHIVCVHNAYNCIHEILENFLKPVMQMRYSFVHGYDTQELLAAIQENTCLIILESPGSDTFTLVDLKAVTAYAKAHDIATYIDNTYCTPLYQKPLELGVDIVMHTATKYMGGHSDVLGGMLITNDDAAYSRLKQLRNLFGGITAPMEAWLILRGLRTMKVRLDEHQRTALQIAQALEKDPRVRRVYYPGLESYPQKALRDAQQSGSCGLLSFEINGTVEQARSVVERLKIFSFGPSWGGFESLVMMPLYFKTDEYTKWYGASRGLIRIHCGLEGTEPLLDDLRQALSVLDEGGKT